MDEIDRTPVTRPWGTYAILHEGPGFKVKSIVVLPGKRLSLQYHYKRAEHWTVVRGTANVLIRPQNSAEENWQLVEKGRSVDIPAEYLHRLENPKAEPMELIEVQLGDYLGEDDIVRVEDDFNRI